MIDFDDCDSNEKFKLFEDKPRDYTRPARRAETTYSFLDRSSLPEFERIRCMLERWVERLPKEHQQKAVANLRHKAPGSGKDENQFTEAFFELFIHEFLTGTGGEVLIDPIIDGLTPDFIVTEELTSGSRIIYVVEATDIDLERGTQLERDWKELEVIDSLNEIASPDFHLYIRMEGKLKSPPSRRYLKRRFENLLEEVKYEEVRLISQKQDCRLEDFPKASFNQGGWTLVAHLMPVSPEYRGRTKNFVANGPMKAGPIDDIGKTKDRLYQKARRYKNMDNLIVALRCDNSNNRLAEVLFGTQQVTVYFNNDPTDTSPLPASHCSQRRDGFWFNSVGPQNENVIGVVAFYGIYPGTLVPGQSETDG